MADPITSNPCPLVIVDVDYRDSHAIAAAIVANTFDAPAPQETRIALINDVAPYKPGSFFKRELPCINTILKMIQSPYQCVVIDGYVDLDEYGRPGLGGHLYSQLNGNVAVIGIAKTPFHGSSFAISVLRGKSQKPLFVTARGIDKDEAGRLVARMHGTHRLPTLVKLVDSLARNSNAPQ